MKLIPRLNTFIDIKSMIINIGKMQLNTKLGILHIQSCAKLTYFEIFNCAYLNYPTFL